MRRALPANIRAVSDIKTRHLYASGDAGLAARRRAEGFRFAYIVALARYRGGHQSEAGRLRDNVEIGK